ncbi:Detected protein of unknown function [Hibiscus syriacus]|uniref:Uncharacterized protein n=1 Tax=Hibiscus syriacus TaxID=106335 RepID=A0A6A2ZDZ0_HIBSY|nr:Detected protein of unknown function [Hibiscus syriacus]
MAALEVTKSNVGSTTVNLGIPEPTAVVIANAIAGLTAAMAAQLISNGIDAFRKIVLEMVQRDCTEAWDIHLTYAPSSLVGSYSVAQRLVWGGVGSYLLKKDEDNQTGFKDCDGGSRSECGNGRRDYSFDHNAARYNQDSVAGSRW